MGRWGPLGQTLTSVALVAAAAGGTFTAANRTTPTVTKVPSAMMGAPSAARAKVQVNVAVGRYAIQRESGSAQAIGFVVNRGNVPVRDIDVVVSLVNASGKVVASGSTAIYTREVLPAGARSPFLVLLNPGNFGAYTKVRIQALGRVHNGETGLSLEGVSVKRPTDEYEPYTITGAVRNQSNKAAELVEITVIGLNKRGTPLAVTSTYASVKRIKPGGASPFALEIYENARAITRHELYVQGRIGP